MTQQQQQQQQHKFLVALDFDNTLIDCDSTSHMMEQLAPAESATIDAFWDMPWNELNDMLFAKLYAAGVSKDAIIRAMRTFAFNPDMLQLFALVKERGGDIAVVSDANTVFITEFFASQNATHFISDTASNPASWTTDGRLHVAPRTNSTTPHGCTSTCPVNLCKGFEVGQYKTQYDRVLFVGDGERDFCGMSKLGPRDVALGRLGHSLESLLIEREPQRVHELQAPLLWWRDAGELITHVSQAL
ncbi:phosphatase phospho-type [Chytriomyces cf. hyalinus JEL632]|nr:phosphatase phospho-type [Chytriomyces cf. hyalinus JEL632]